MTAEEYWTSEGVRFLNQDGTIPTVEERVKEAFIKGQEESRTWHSHYRDEVLKAQKCKQAYIELEKEVAKLREQIQKLQNIANRACNLLNLKGGYHESHSLRNEIQKLKEAR
jgi:hypothetical protein